MKKYDRSTCQFGSSKTQLELTLDFNEKLNGSKYKLEQLVSCVSATLDSNKKAEFDTSQKAWELYAHAWSYFESNQSDGGTIRPMLYSQTMVKLIKQRISQLKQILHSKHFLIP